MFGRQKFNSPTPFNSRKGTQAEAVTFLEALLSWIASKVTPTVYLGFAPQSSLTSDTVILTPKDKEIYLDIFGRSLKARRTGFEIECRSTTKATSRALAKAIDLALDRTYGYVSGHRFVDCQVLETSTSHFRHQNAWIYSTTLTFDLFHYEAS